MGCKCGNDVTYGLLCTLCERRSPGSRFGAHSATVRDSWDLAKIAAGGQMGAKL
jgi:hypothetical protein